MEDQSSNDFANFHQAGNDDEPDDDPGDPVSRPLFDIFVNDLELRRGVSNALNRATLELEAIIF